MLWILVRPMMTMMVMMKKQSKNFGKRISLTRERS